MWFSCLSPSAVFLTSSSSCYSVDRLCFSHFFFSSWQWLSKLKQHSKGTLLPEGSSAYVLLGYEGSHVMFFCVDRCFYRWVAAELWRTGHSSARILPESGTVCTVCLTGSIWIMFLKIAAFQFHSLSNTVYLYSILLSLAHFALCILFSKVFGIV